MDTTGDTHTEACINFHKLVKQIGTFNPYVMQDCPNFFTVFVLFLSILSMKLKGKLEQ